MKQSNYSEIAYLLRQNKANFDNIVGIDIDKKYTIKCNGVKMSSFAKKNRVRLCENIEQKILLQGGCNIDKKPNGFISRKKALKAK